MSYYYGPGVTDPTGMAQVVSGTHASAPRHIKGRGLGGFARRIAGTIQLVACTFVAVSLLTWSVTDPSLTHISSGGVRNWMGPLGAIVSDLLVQLLGVASIFAVLPPAYWALQLANQGHLQNPKRKLAYAPLAVMCLALAWSSLPEISSMPFRHGYGGVIGDILYGRLTSLLSIINATRAGMAAGLFGLAIGLLCLQRSFGLTRAEMKALFQFPASALRRVATHGQGAAAISPLTIEPQVWTQPQYAPAGAYAPQPLSGPIAWAQQHPSAAHYTAPAHPDAYARAQQSWQPPAGQAQPYASPPVYAAPVQPAPLHDHQPTLPAPARQAWLRPMPRAQHKGNRQSDQANETAERLSATDRRHAPAFDRDTAQQSRSIAERFAPAGIEVTESSHAPMERIDPILEAPHEFATPVIDRAVPPPREPEIIMPREPEVAPHAPVLDRAVTVAPGGFFARLTDTRRHGEAHSQHYKRPSLNLLKRPVAPPSRGLEVTAEKLRDRSLQLLETLGDFGIKGEIVAVRPGPVVTLFEFEPARGTKSSRVIGLADDIARSMSARAVRIAVVPGVNAIGIELPNATREPVGFRELLETEQFRSTNATLPLALGKGIGGEPVIADLTRMPHLLVAGTTGSGKSVGVNAMILSLLYQLTPDDCRMILIDPKMLELSVYNGIPHLLTPVVTDPNKAIAALNWAVGETESRYKRMSQLSVRNIEVYNTRVRAAAKPGEQRAAPVDAEHTPMPHIVIVVDEFADLMAVAGKEIEFAVQRLAQMARAAGIHLIMATQRPSVDIITGTIKANFPTRISFRVTSRIDSRTILNEQGAEQLLGQGDMLYAAGSGQVVRVHGPFVSDDEVETIATYLRSQGTPAYVDGITDTPDLEAADKAVEVVDDDHLYDRAVALLRADKKASISYLQRKLAIGYNRAADIIDRMEADGLVSAPNAAGKRELLLLVDPVPPAPAPKPSND